MLKTRKDLMDAVEKLYESLFAVVAKRYVDREQFVVSDMVGYEVTALEELFRPLWGIAPLILERDLWFSLKGERVKAADFINRVIIEGTDKDSERRFDRNVTGYTRINFANQAVTELAAYLVAAYFAKEKIWDVLQKQQQDSIAEWIYKWSLIAINDSWPNNHYWYPVFCIEILRRLGYPCKEADEALENAYAELEKLYIGNGWYYDGKLGRFDYYEAWAHQAYTLLWILIADKEAPGYSEKAELYKRRCEEFIRFYVHFFDADGGMAAFGRSLSYRFAAVTNFGLAAKCGCAIDLSLTKNIILKNIGYFFENSIPAKDGIFHCGYLYETPAFAENYATDGASTCYTEGLMCLLCGEEHPLWCAETGEMPIEKGDYTLKCPNEKIGIVLTGENEYGGVTLYNNSMHYYQDAFFGHSFNDMSAYYGKFCYNSRAGFAISTRDKASLDNMISLVTPNGRMESQRSEIITISTDENLLISRHVPFANDEESRITSYVVPLSGGWHVRMHKATLSRPYIISEGGFTVGTRDDRYEANGNTVKKGNTVSRIEAIFEQKINYAPLRIHPGMHLLSPQAVYPTYMTDVLEKGEYLIGCKVLFTTTGKSGEEPRVTVNGNTVTVAQGEKTVTFDMEG